MGKRIFLFILTNLAVVLTLTIVLSILGVGRYVGPGGLNIGALATFCFVWGMGGAFISLEMSRWIAKRATGMTIVDGHTGDTRINQVYSMIASLTQKELAKRLGVSPRAVNELIRERRSMTADMAIRLSRVFKTTPDIWMNLQKTVDLWDAAQANKNQYAKLRPIAA